MLFFPNSSMQKTTYMWWYLLPIILYASAILYTSSISDLPTIRGVMAKEPIQPGAWTGDEIEHIIVYAIFSFLVYRAVQQTTYRSSDKAAFLVTFCFLALFGILDELHQSTVPLRTMSMVDFFYDLIGAATIRVTSKLLV